MATDRPPNHSQLPRRSAADLSGEAQRVMGKLEATGQDLTILRLIANAPHSFRPYILLSDSLLNRATLPPEVREVAILWMAQRRNVEYERLEHLPMAARAGLNEAQLARLEEGEVDAETFSDAALLAVSIAGHLLDGDGVPAELWEQARSLWGDAGALDLLFTVGWWGGFVPLLIEGLGLVAPDGT